MFCRYCGREIVDDSAFCQNCGRKLSINIDSGVSSSMIGHACIRKLAKRLKKSSIIWLIIGTIQLLLGVASLHHSLSFSYLVLSGILNSLSGFSDMSLSRAIRKDPVGIVNRIKPAPLPILTLIYNIILGGLIGIVGAVYYLSAVRGFLLKNEKYFLAAETDFAFRE